MYEIRLYNPFTFGSKVLKGETISEVKEKLSNYYVDHGTRVKLFKVEEISLDDDCYELFDVSKYEMKEFNYRGLYRDCCIPKKQVIIKC